MKITCASIKSIKVIIERGQASCNSRTSNEGRESHFL